MVRHWNTDPEIITPEITDPETAMPVRPALSRRLGVLALAVFAAVPASAQEVTLTLHQFLPRQSAVPAHILDAWIANVEEASDGRIAVNHFPSMQLGGTPPELIDQAIDGVADIIWTVVGYTPGRFPRTEVFELPFFVDDAEAASHAFWQMHERHMAGADFAEVEVLGTWVHGPGVIHTDVPVETPGDLRGLRIRGGSRLVNQMLTAVGAESIGMPVPAIPEALSRGVLDGATIPWEVTTALRTSELVEHHTEFADASLYTLTFVMAMNRDRYDSLPDDLRAVIDAQSGADFSTFAGRTQASYDAPGRAIAVERGNSIVTVTDIAPWEALARPVYDAWVADMAERGIDGQALIDEARALMERYSPAD